MSEARSEARRRGRFAVTVVNNEPVCREHYRLVLLLSHAADFPPTAPGQFVQLAAATALEAADGEPLEWSPQQPPAPEQSELREPTPFLRRPYSIAGRRNVGEGVEIDVIYRVVGLGTRWLERLRPGDGIDLIGPLGNRFTLPAERSHALLVGGGVGLPPMFYLAEAVADAGWSGCAFVGAMSADLLAVRFAGDEPAHPEGRPSDCVEPFMNFALPAVVTTNDGSAGLRGLITDGLKAYLERCDGDQLARSVIYTCGPDAMMHAVAALAAGFDVPCQACVEQAMACGMGTCQSCVLRLRDEEHPQGEAADGVPWRYRLACTDGPVFDAAQIVW